MTVASSRTKGVTSCSLTASATVTGSVSRSQIVAAASVAASKPTTPATLIPIRARLMISRWFSYDPNPLDGVTPAQVYVASGWGTGRSYTLKTIFPNCALSSNRPWASAAASSGYVRSMTGANVPSKNSSAALSNSPFDPM